MNYIDQLSQINPIKSLNHHEIPVSHHWILALSKPPDLAKDEIPCRAFRVPHVCQPRWRRGDQEPWACEMTSGIWKQQKSANMEIAPEAMGIFKPTRMVIVFWQSWQRMISQFVIGNSSTNWIGLTIAGAIKKRPIYKIQMGLSENEIPLNALDTHNFQYWNIKIAFLKYSDCHLMRRPHFHDILFVN